LRNLVNDILCKGEQIPALDCSHNRKDLALPSDTDDLCPRCQGRLRTTNYGYNSNIMVEKCLSCDGLWLDHGKLMQLAGYIKNADEMREVIRLQEQAQAEAEKEQADEPEETSGVYAVLVSLAGIPAGDDVGHTRTPWCTAGLVVLNVLVYLYQTFVTADVHALVQGYGLIPAALMHGNHVTSLITHMFLHSSVLHLAGNMLYLWVFGDNIEDELGHLPFLIFYIFGGLLAAAFHILVYAAADMPMIGASGAVAGILGAYLVLHPNARVNLVNRYGYYTVRAEIYIGAWFALQGINAYTAISGGRANGVAWFAHIGGFAGGLAVALVYRFMRQPRWAAPT